MSHVRSHAPRGRFVFSLAVGALLFAAPVERLEAQEPGKIYSGAELTTPPSVKSASAAASAIESSYPNGMRSVGGKVQLQFVVQPDGKVDPSSIEVMVASVAQLGEAAKKAVQKIQFNPGKVDGTPVSTVVKFPIVYAAN
jgi:protein TonB